MKHHLLLLAAALLLAQAASADPLARPAQPSPLADKRLINGLARVGASRLVAVGQRGHILVSDDGGKSWVQSQVPVSSDLTAVQFVNEKTGFAVGHDGVLLSSENGGKSWTKLLDGRQINALVLAQLEQKGASAELIAEAKRNTEAGPDKPLLDLWFKNAREGYVIGAYNLILRTQDGGKSWTSWFDLTDNPRLLNLYAIRPQGESLFIAGEGGLLMRLSPEGQRFEALASPYKGSFFGLLPTPSGLVAFGMRGHAFKSTDEGRSWQPISTGLAASITAGDVGIQGQVVLVDQGGRMALSRDGALSFRPQRLPVGAPAAATLLLDKGQIIVGGPRGLRAQAL